MSLLQRRLLQEFFRLFFLAVGGLLILILMGRGIYLRDMLTGLEIGFVDALRLFGYMSPLFLPMICPGACILAVFITFLRFSNDREMTALRAGGISLYQMLPATLIFGLVACGLTLVVTLVGQGWGMGNFRAELLEIAGNRAKIIIRPGIFHHNIPNMVFFARQVNPQTGQMAQIMVEDSSIKQNKMIILASEGNVGTDYLRGELNFLLKNGRIYMESDSLLTVLSFDEYIVRLGLNSLFRDLNLGALAPKEMTWRELTALPVNDIMLDNPRLGHRIKIEMHNRFVLPVACLVFSIFAMPISMGFTGMQKQGGPILAVLFFLFYFSLYSIGTDLAKSGFVSTAVGMWSANAVFLLLSAIGMYLAGHERMPQSADFMRRLRQMRARRQGERQGECQGEPQIGTGGGK